MKKILAVLLATILMASLTACSGGNTTSDVSGAGDSVSQDQSDAAGTVDSQSGETDTDGKTESTSSTTAAEKKSTTAKVTAKKTTTQKKTTKPAKLNPKTDFKFGKYITTFFANNNQSYHEISLEFFEEFDGLEYKKENFYTKEQCKKRYEDMQMEFDEDSFSYDFEKTINGVTYYNIGDYEILSEAYEITDKVIKVCPDMEKWGVLSLNADGTLAVDDDADGRYGKAGTVFTFMKSE